MQRRETTTMANTAARISKSRAVSLQGRDTLSAACGKLPEADLRRMPNDCRSHLHRRNARSTVAALTAQKPTSPRIRIHHAWRISGLYSIGTQLPSACACNETKRTDAMPPNHPASRSGTEQVAKAAHQPSATMKKESRTVSRDGLCPGCVTSPMTRLHDRIAITKSTTITNTRL